MSEKVADIKEVIFKCPMCHGDVEVCAVDADDKETRIEGNCAPCETHWIWHIQIEEK